MKAKELPHLSITIPTICYGEKAVISVDKTNSVADYYIWSDNSENNFSWESSDGLKKDSIFKFSASLNGCKVDTTVTISPKENPVIKITDKNNIEWSAEKDSTVCPNAEIVLNATDTAEEPNVPAGKETSFSWSWNTGTPVTSASMTNNPADQTTYQVTATNQYGCTSNTSRTVKVFSPQKLQLTGDPAVCQNGSATVVTDATGIIEWGIIPSTYTNTTIDPSNKLTINNCDPGTISVYVTGEDEHQCPSASDTFKIVVVKRPELTITPLNRNVCVGSSIKLTANGGSGVAIQWEGKNRGLLDNIYTPESTGANNLTVTGYYVSNGIECETDSTIIVNALALPTFEITGEDVCQGDTAVLKVENASNFSSIRWLGYTENVNPINVTKSGTYNVTVKDNNGCVKDSSKTIEIHPNPSFVIIRKDEITDNTVCNGETVTLEAVGSGYTFEWFNGNSSLNSTETTNGSSITPTITTDNVFSAVASKVINNNLTCTSRKDYEVKVAPLPNFSINPTIVCKGQHARVTLTVNTSGTSFVWNWNDGGTDMSQSGSYVDFNTVNETRNFSVTGTLGHCTKTINDRITPKELPAIDQIDPFAMCINDQKVVTVTASNPNNSDRLFYSWSADRDGSSMTFTENVLTIKPTQTGLRTYTSKVSDGLGCFSTMPIAVTVNPLPNIDITGNTNVCAGVDGNVHLYVEGNQNVNWYRYDETKVNDNYKGSLIGSDTLKQTISEATKYVIEVNETSNDKVCSNFKVVEVTTKQNPTIQVYGNKPVCLGESLDLTILGNSGGKILPSPTNEYETTSPIILRLTPTVSKDYTIYMESSEGCPFDTIVPIVTNRIPNVTIENKKDGDTTICYNSEIVLHATGDNVAHKWNNGITTDENTVKPLIETRYYVVGTENGCSDTAWHTVKIQSLPTISLSGDEKACVDSFAYITITDYQSAYDYAWTPTPKETVGGKGKVKITEGVNNYKVTVKDNTQLQCENSSTYTIKSKANPTITITGNDRVCLNGKITLTAFSSLSGSSYEWYENGEATGTTTNTLLQLVNGEKNITVKVTKDGCSNDTTFKTQYYDLPALTLTADKDTICYNTSATLEVQPTGTEPFSYNWKSNYVTTNDQQSATTYYLTNTTSPYNFEVEVTDGHNCVNSKSIPIVVQANPNVSITGDKSVCDGSAARLNANGALTYVWSTGETTASISSIITSDSSFYVTGTDKYGCEGRSKKYTVTKKNNPTLFFSGSREICEGQSTTITVSGAGASDSNYKWYYDSENPSSTDTIKANHRQFSPSHNAQYKILATLNGCETDSTIEIKVNENPSITISAENGAVVSGNKAFICEGDSIQLNTTASGNIASYNWSNNKTTDKIKVSPTAELTEYSVIVRNDKQCSATDNFFVQVNKKPIVDVVYPEAVCLGGDIEVSAVDIPGYPTPSSYSWTFDNNAISGNTESFSRTVSTNGVHEIKLTTQKEENGKVCYFEKEVSVDTKDNPTFTATAKESDICHNQFATIQISNSDADYYVWPDDSKSTAKSWTDNIILDASSTSHTYKVKGYKQYLLRTDVLTCDDSVFVDVNIHERPQVKIDGPAFLCTETTTGISVKGADGSSIPDGQYEYYWSTGATTNAITVAAPTEEVIYTVTVTNTTTTCDTTLLYKLSSYLNPTFNIAGSDDVYCEGDEAEFSIEGGNNISSIVWKDFEKDSILGTEETLKQIASSNNVIIEATIRTTDGCDVSKKFTFNTKPKPTLTVNAPDYVCKGSTATIKITGANNYYWDKYPDLHTGNLSLTLNRIGRFNVRGEVNGCYRDTNIVVGVYSGTPVEISAQDEAGNPLRISASRKVEICYGDKITLIASGPLMTSYSWENILDGDTAVITKQPLENTVFTVEGTDRNGCKRTDDVQVIINYLPEFNVPARTYVCEDSSVVISATSQEILSYKWEDDFVNEARHQIESIQKDSTYSVIAKNNKGCISNPVSYQIVKKPNPKLVISGDSVCDGAPALLTVTDTSSQSNYQTTYVWNRLPEKTGSTYTTEEISGSATITVTGTKNECSSSAEATIYTYQLPSITIDNGEEETVCSQSSLKLFASGGERYKWDGKPITSDNSYEIYPTVDGETHSVWGQDKHGCEGTDEITIRIQNRPKFYITGDSRVCEDSVVTLTANYSQAGSNYTFTWKDKDGNTIGSTISSNSVKLTITKDTTIFVTAKDQTGKLCDTTITYDIATKVNPTIELINNDNSVCKGTYATVIVGGDANNYYWKNASGNVVSQTNTIYREVNKDSETFIVYAEKENCVSNKEITLYGLNNPTISLSNATVCYGDSVKLQVETEDVIYSYSWDNITSQKHIATTVSADGTTPANNQMADLPKLTSIYHVTAENMDHCKTIDSATVTVNPLPTLRFKADKSACENNDVIISTENTTGITYSWEGHGADGTYKSEYSHAFKMGDYPDVSKFVIYGKSALGCVDSSIVEINTKQIPSLRVKFDTACYGNGINISGMNLSAKYVWSLESGYVLSTFNNFKTDDMYYDSLKIHVQGTVNGCTNDSMFTIHTYPLPTVKIKDAPRTIVCIGSQTELSVKDPVEGWSYKWNNSDFKVNDTTLSIYANKNSQNTVYAKDDNGCVGSADIEVHVINNPSFTVEGANEICVNNDIKLRGSDNTLRYEWYDSHDKLLGETNGTNLFTLHITQDTIVQVKGFLTGTIPCEAMVTHVIKANPYPTITFEKFDPYVCYKNQTYIEVKSDVDATFLWNTGETERFIQKEITEETHKFIVTATSTSSTLCESKDSIEVHMLPLPKITAENQKICYGDSATLVAQEADNRTDITYRWDAAESDTNAFVTPSLTSTTIYNVKGVDSHGCVGRTSAIVSIMSLPQFSLTSISPVCRGSETTITASDATLKYVWEDNKEGSFQDGNQFSLSVGQDTTFVVWAQDENLCKNKKEVKVKVKEYPVLTLRMDTDYVCFNESRTVYVAGATNGYRWNNDPSQVSNYLRLENVTKDTAIYVEGTTNGCVSRIDTVIKVWELPNIKIQPIDNICLRQPAKLVATGGKSNAYKWSTGSSEDSIIVTPVLTGATTYSVTGVDENGCKNYDTIKVVVNELPSVSIKGEEFVCRGDSTTLSAIARTAVEYEWHMNGVAIENATGSKFKTAIEDDSYTYWLVVKDANSCVDSASFDIKAKEYPILSHKTTTGRDSVCVNGAITIYVSGAEDYIWEEDNSVGNAFSDIIAKPKEFKVAGTTNGCTTPYVINIDTLQLPIFEITGDNVICLNDSVTLTATPNQVENRGELIYKWRHNGESSPTIKEAPITNKTYEVSGTDEYGCKSNVTYNVTVNALPSDLTITGDKSACYDSTVVLTAYANNAVRYDWIRNEVSTDTIQKEEASITASITSDTTFYVIVTDINNCRFQNSYDVKKIDHPTLTFGTTDPYVCYGERATISVKGATSYVWENDNSTKNFRSDVITNDTTFVVTGTANGCSTKDSIKIKVRELPTISIKTYDADSGEESDKICKGQGRIKLVGEGAGDGGSYTWSTKEEKDFIIVSPASSTEYGIVGVDKYGCQNKADTIITVYPIPVITIESESKVCENDSFDLIAKTTDEFVIKEYVWNGFPEVNNDTLKTSITKEQTFYVKVTDDHNCYNNAKRTVSAKAYPILSFESPSYVCKGNSAIISVKGASTYKWISDKEVTQRSFVDIPEKDTTYVVEGTTNGCTSIDSVHIEVKDLPIISIESESGSDHICLNDSIKLKGKGGDPDRYTWNTGSTNSSITVHPLVETEYRIIGKDEFGCQNEANFTVFINPLPSFVIKGNELVCQGDIDTLWVEGDEATYTWTSHSNLVSDSIMIAIDNDQEFNVRAEDANKCVSYATKNVKTKDYPKIEINAPDAICENDIASLIATGAASYVWEDGRTENSIMDTITGTRTYTVKGTTNGCTSEAKKTIEMWPLPNVKILCKTNKICLNQSVYMEASGADSYIWSDGSYTKSINVKPSTTTKYYLIGKSINNCESRDTFEVTVNPLPTVVIEGDAAVCYDNTAELVAKGANTYVWSTQETTDTIRPNILTTQTFTVLGTDTNNCSSSATKQVKKKDIPVLTYATNSPVCLGEIATITVLGANSYLWNDANESTGNSLNTVPQNDTAYTVIGYLDGCEATKTINIQVLPLPNIDITGESEVCVNESINLTASGASSYVWSNGLQSETLSATPLSSMTYTVVGTDENGCKNTTFHDVTVNPLPDFRISGEKAVCKGSETTLSGESNTDKTYSYTWEWTENGTDLSETNQTITANIMNNTSFKITATDDKGCSSDHYMTVVSKQFPTISFAAPKTVCQNEGLSITAFGANEYKWDIGSTTNQMSDNPKEVGVVTYSVTGTTDGCESTASISVDVLQRPQVFIEGNTEICNGESVTLTASGAKTYEWNNGLNEESIKQYPSIDTKYTVRGTNEFMCTDTATIHITVHQKPIFDIISENEVCAEQNLTMMASGNAKTYYWGYGDKNYDDNTTFNNDKIEVPIERPIYIFVKGVDENNCYSEKYKQIKTILPPSIFFIGETDVCLGQDVTLMGQGGDAYIWNVNGKSHAGARLIFTPTENTPITLTGTLGMCSSTIPINITTKAVPDLKIEGDSSICKGETATLNAFGAVHYTWSTKDTTSRISKALKTSNKFYVTGIGYNGCESRTSFTVNVKPLPNVVIHKDYMKGCPAIGTTVRMSVTGANSYVWHSTPQDGEIEGILANHIEARLDEPTDIYVVGTDKNGCSMEAHYMITPEVTGETKFEVSPQIFEEDNPIITMKGFYPDEGSSWSWNPGNDDIVNGKDVIYKYPVVDKDSFLVEVSAIDKDGCEYTGETYVYVWRDFWAPNAFTPNGDGNNDVFRFLGTEFLTEFSYIIYNRQGTIVFEGDSKDDFWDGTNKDGVKCPQGVYGYVAKYKSNYKGLRKRGEKKGMVTLIR